MFNQFLTMITGTKQYEDLQVDFYGFEMGNQRI